MHALALIGFAAGCVQTTDEPTPADLDVFHYEAPEEPTADLEVDELTELATQVIAEAFSYDAGAMLAVYFDLMEDSTDESCPTLFQSGDSDYWIATADGAGGQATEGEQGGCVTESETEFRGWAYTQVYDEYEDENWITDQRYLSALAWIWPNDGTLYECAGTLLVSLQVQLSEVPMTLGESRIQGVFGWDGVGVEGTWMERGELPDMRIASEAILQRRIIEIEGGVSNLETYDGIDAFSFQDFTYANEFRCAEEPSGVLSLRQPDGHWYDIVFDAPNEDQEEQISDDPACDGCGVVWFHGEVLGMSCPEFWPLLAWESHPWE